LLESKEIFLLTSLPVSLGLSRIEKQEAYAMSLHCFLNVFIFSAILQTAAPAGLSWDFSADPLSTLPKGWEARGKSARPVYEVKADADGNRYLAAQSDRSDVQLGLNIQGEAKGLFDPLVEVARSRIPRRR
jgi:hypothetical protein